MILYKNRVCKHKIIYHFIDYYENMRYNSIIYQSHPNHKKRVVKQLAKETIDAVRQAELTAEQTERAAAQEADRIVAKAKLDAKQTVTDLTKNAKEKALAELAAARAQGDELVAKAVAEVQEDCRRLREAAAAKQAQATEAILAELI